MKEKKREGEARQRLQTEIRQRNSEARAEAGKKQTKGKDDTRETRQQAAGHKIPIVGCVDTTNVLRPGLI